VLRIVSIAVLVALGCTFLSGASLAAGAFTLAAGANGAWLQGPDAAFPQALEAGATASSSLSPHISLVGSGFYGFKENYERYSAGARVTATDVADPNFNVYLGVQYRGGSKDSVRPNEWAPDAGFGWKPNKNWPRVIVGADAGYGLQSNKVLAIVALRYVLVAK